VEAICIDLFFDMLTDLGFPVRVFPAWGRIEIFNETVLRFRELLKIPFPLL